MHPVRKNPILSAPQRWASASIVIETTDVLIHDGVQNCHHLRVQVVGHESKGRAAMSQSDTKKQLWVKIIMRLSSVSRIYAVEADMTCQI